MESGEQLESERSSETRQMATNQNSTRQTGARAVKQSRYGKELGQSISSGKQTLIYNRWTVFSTSTRTY